ncbi:hypothetical protein TNCV_3305201 [Trichonephila clavipes]|nr:hypothetical protein TNCV_3305201 [Trichonephila clavipes]
MYYRKTEIRQAQRILVYAVRVAINVVYELWNRCSKQPLFDIGQDRSSTVTTANSQRPFIPCKQLVETGSQYDVYQRQFLLATGQRLKPSNPMESQACGVYARRSMVCIR